VSSYHRAGTGRPLLPGGRHPARVSYTLEISDDLRERMDTHLEDDESYEEFIAELLSLYETEGAFLQEGYSE